MRAVASQEISKKSIPILLRATTPPKPLKGNDMITSYTIKTTAAKALLTGSLALIGVGLASGNASAFNPQPEPPTAPSTVSAPSEFVGPIPVRGVHPAPVVPSKPSTQSTH